MAEPHLDAGLNGEGELSAQLLNPSSRSYSHPERRPMLPSIGSADESVHTAGIDTHLKAALLGAPGARAVALSSPQSISRRDGTRYRPWSRLHRALLSAGYGIRLQRSLSMGAADGTNADGVDRESVELNTLQGSPGLKSSRVSVRQKTPGKWMWWSYVKHYLDDILQDYVLWGNLFNLLGCLGYVGTDLARGYFNDHVTVSSIAYIVLAWVFVFDSIVYWAAWQGCEEPPVASARLADFFNILGSFGYAATAFMYPYEESEQMLFTVITIESVLAIVFLVSCLAYMKAWLYYLQPTPAAPRGCTIWDADMWANLTQVLAALAYVVAQGVGLWYFYTYPRDRKRSIVTSEAMSFISRVGFFGDVLYAVAAACYCYVWVRDVREAAREEANALKEANGQSVPSSTEKKTSDEPRPAEDPASGFQPFWIFPRLCGTLWATRCWCCYLHRRPQPPGVKRSSRSRGGTGRASSTDRRQLSTDRQSTSSHKFLGPLRAFSEPGVTSISALQTQDSRRLSIQSQKSLNTH